MTLYLNAMYDSYAMYANHGIRDLNVIHGPYGCVYMTSNYEMYVNYVNDANRALHMHL